MGTNALSRQEARDRGTALRPASYRVVLDLTADGDTFLSDTEVRFGAAPGAASFIDLTAAGVEEITLNGHRLDPGLCDPATGRIPLSGLLADNTLRVVAHCRYQTTGVGLHRFVDPVDGETYLFTHFEPFDAHRVFACFDQPDLKATFALTVDAPVGWSVISNSPVTERRGHRWTFGPTPPMSTYLCAVAAGNYHSVRDRHGRIPLGLWCRQSLAEHLDATEILTVTRQGLDFFQAEFDYPYPFAKYDQVFVPEHNLGAMENPGCVTVNDRMLYRSRQTDAAYEARAGLILHEMAHMWFGDLVTMRWWDDLWLNESFATLLATRALTRSTRFTGGWVRFASDTKAAAMAQDQLPSTHPISADVVDTDAVRLQFDGITYAKGASVLKQLQAWVGEDAFLRGVRHYLKRHEWSAAELPDFLASLEEASGRDLDSWAEEWLLSTGVNTLSLQTNGEGSLDIVQESAAAHPTLRRHRIAVGFYRSDGDGVVLQHRQELDVTGARTAFPSSTEQASADLVLVNDDDLTYAKVRMDARSLATMADHLGDVVDPLARQLCWAAAWDMVRDAALPAHGYLDLVVRHGPSEPDDTTLGRLLSRVVAGTDLFGDPGRRRDGRQRLAGWARGHLEAAGPGTDRQVIWARHYLTVMDGGTDLAYARRLLDGNAELRGLTVDNDLRWKIVATLASRGLDNDGRLVDAEVERDPTDSGQRRAGLCRACRPTADAKAEAWARLVDGEMHLAFIGPLAAGFWQHGQDELLAPYVEPYFRSLAGFWADRSPEEALAATGRMYPATLVGPGVLALTERALGDELPAQARRILIERKDAMERAQRARMCDA